MRINKQHIQELQKILKQQTNKDYTDEEAQQAGLAIMRFTLAKKRRELELKEKANGGTKTIERSK